MLLMIHCSWPFLGYSVQREYQFRNEKYKLIGKNKTNNSMGSSSGKLKTEDKPPSSLTKEKD